MDDKTAFLPAGGAGQIYSERFSGINDNIKTLLTPSEGSTPKIKPWERDWGKNPGQSGKESNLKPWERDWKGGESVVAAQQEEIDPEREDETRTPQQMYEVTQKRYFNYDEHGNMVGTTGAAPISRTEKRARLFTVDGLAGFDAETKKRIELQLDRFNTGDGVSKEYTEALCAISMAQFYSDFGKKCPVGYAYQHIAEFNKAFFGKEISSTDAYHAMHDTYTGGPVGQATEIQDTSFSNKALMHLGSFTTRATTWVDGGNAFFFNAIGATQEGVDRLLLCNFTGEYSGNKWYDAGGYYLRRAQEMKELGAWAMHNADIAPDFKSWGGAGNFAIQTLLDAAPQTTLALLNPASAGIYIGMMSGGGTYETAINDYGADRGQAATAAMLSAWMNREFFNRVENVILQGQMPVFTPFKGPFANFCFNLSLQTFYEAGQERIEQNLDNAILLVTEVAKADTFEEFIDFLNQGANEEMAGGALLGFIMSGIGLSRGGKHSAWSRFKQHQELEKIRGNVKQRGEALSKMELRTPAQQAELNIIQQALAANDLNQVLKAAAFSTVLKNSENIDPKAAREDLTVEERSAQAVADNKVHRVNNTAFDVSDTVAEVERVKDLLRINDRTRINAVENFDALPDAVKRDIEEKGYRAEGIDAYYYDGKTYLIADRVNPARVYQRVMHEYVTHAGLRAVMRDHRFNELMDIIWEEHGDEIRESSWAAGYGYKENWLEDFAPEYRNMDRNDPRFQEYAEKFEDKIVGKQRELAEEWLAREAEKMAAEMRRGIESQELGRWRKFLARIRKFLAEHHLLPKSYLDRLDDRTLTDMLCHITEKAGYSIVYTDQHQTWSSDGRAAAGGDVGARNLGRGQDLETAKLMHDFGKEMHAIKLATGFELSDGEWKLEIPDLKIKTQNALEPYFFFQGPLEDYIDAPEIFKAYPQLKKMPLLIGDTGNADAYYTSTYKRIVMNSENQMDAANRCYSIKDKGSEQQYKQAVVNYYRNLRSILIHEVQHAIQDIEGFAPGGSLERAKEYKNQRIPELNEKIRVAGNKVEALRGREDVKQYEAALADRMKKFSAEVTEGMKNNTPRSEVLDHHWEEVDKIRERYPVFEELQAAQNELNRLITDRSLLLKDDDYGIYSRFAGEVESRNMQRRADMSDEERRQSLFDDTADTVPGSRIYLDGERGGESMALPDDKINFQSALMNYKNGLLNHMAPVVVTSETPAIYLKLDMSDKGIRIFNRKITMPYSVIDKAVGKVASTTTEDFHNVSLDKLKDLPDSLYNPVMVLHGSRDGTIEVYTQIFDDSHRPVMVVLEIDLVESLPTKKKSRKDHTYTVNSIRSIYGKDNANTAINKVKKGDFWYFNKKLAEEWCRAAGVQFPGAGDIMLRLPYTIIDPGEKSIWIGEKNAKKSGRGDVDMASQLDPALEDQMVEALLAPTQKVLISGDILAWRKEGARKYLVANGFPDVGDTVSGSVLVSLAEDRLKEINRRKERRAAFDNYRQMDPLFDFIVEFAGGGENLIVNPGEKYIDTDVRGSFISPEWKSKSVKRPQGKRESDASYKKYLAKREAALAKVEGAKLDEIAHAYAEQFGGDEAEIEQQMFDLLKDLTKKDISNVYATYKKDHLAYEKKLNDEAEAEFKALKVQQAKDDAAKMLKEGGEITPEFLEAHRDVVDEIYRALLKKEPPAKIGKKDLAAINAALLAGGEESRATFAQAYKVAAEKAYLEFVDKMREFRESEAKDAAAVNALQQKAMDFAEKNVPKELRGEFVRQIVALSKMSDANGKRSEAFEKLLEKMVDVAADARKESEIAKIRQLFNENKIVRKGKGIPESKIPSVQNEVDELRRIFRLSPAALDAYRNTRLDAMLNGDPESDAYQKAQKELAASYLFGDLSHRQAQNAADAREYLEDLVNGAQREYKNHLAEKLEKIQQIRSVVRRQNNGEVIDTGAKVDAKKLSEYVLRNRAGIESYLLLASGKQMGSFEKTWEYGIARRVFEGEEKQATFERELDAEFRAAAEKCCGVKLTRAAWQKFINKISKVVEHTGIYRNIYETKINEGGDEILLEKKRPAIRTDVPWQIAAEAFGAEGDAITGFYRFTGKDALQKRGAVAALLKAKGIDSDRFVVFVVEGKNAVAKLHGKAVATVPSNAIRAENGMKPIDAAIAYFVKNNLEQVVKTEVGNVSISATDIKKSLSHGFYQNKLDAIPAIPFVLKDGAYLGALPDKDGKPQMNYYFAAPVVIGQESKIVFVRARKSSGDVNANLYVHEVFTEDDVKKLGKKQTAPSLSSEVHNNFAEFYLNIIANAPNVKPISKNHIYAIEDGVVKMVEVPVGDVPGIVTKLSPEARRFAEKQAADLEAGVVTIRGFFRKHPTAE